MKEITAEILCIGDELLIGQTVNTNAAWIGERLSAIGIRPVLVRTIGDDHEGILAALRAATADAVLITGGLGPTKDDITKQALCAFFGTRLVRHADIEARIAAYFRSMGREPLEVNLAQADLPQSCTVLPNALGTASGMWFSRPAPAGGGQQVFVSMPGVPYEMKAIMQEHALPALQQAFRPPAIEHRTLLTTGMGESHLAERIAAWEDSLGAEGIKLAYLPSPGLVKLRLSTYANADRDAARNRVAAKADELYRLIPELIFGEGDERLEQVVGRLLRDRGQALALAESCTGGYASHLITSVPGSSAYFLGGVVSYANAVKEEALGVPREMLERHGAVSQAVAERMAEGVRSWLRADWGVAVSGVAGPDGGTPEKPVGTVWMAVAGPDGTWARRGAFPGDRSVVIRRSALAALNMLRLSLLGKR